MIWIVLTVISMGILFATAGVCGGSRWRLNKKQLITPLGLIFILMGSVTVVPANHVGIIYSVVNGVQEQTIGEGIKTKSVLDKIYKISTEVQTSVVEDLTTQTQDAQFLNSTLDIKYKVSADNAFLIFKQYRTLDNMSENFIIPTTQRVLELVTTRYNVIDILGEKRSEVYAALNSSMKAEMAQYGIDFVSISITDMDAGQALEEAITAEAVAKKSVETAEQELLRAQTEAKQKSVEAQAEQEATKIKAETRKIEAQAEKEANEVLSNSLTENILQQQWIEKWNGELPLYYGGEGNVMIPVSSGDE